MIMAPHLQTIKITQIAAHPLLLQQLPLEILPHPVQKKFAKVLLDNYSTVKVKRQKVWISARGNLDLEMSYCPTPQLLQRETWDPFLESPPKIAGPALPKTRGPEKKPRRTPNDSEVLVIWVRRLNESSFSSVCTSFLTLITKLQNHSAGASS